MKRRDFIRGAAFAAVLACCPGYSRYALKPNAILNETGRRCRLFVEKIREATFDREYAKGKDSDFRHMMPFRENWLAGRLMWDMRSLYTCRACPRLHRGSSA